MDIGTAAALLCAGFAAGTVNAVAGGGPLVTVPVLLAVGLASVYGGYFGAAMGVMLVAAIGLVLDASLRQVNAVKNLVSAVVGLTTVAVFGLVAAVDWAAVGILAPATMLGGYTGARIAR